MNTAVRTPRGTPMKMAPKVPVMEVRIMGRIPNFGFSAVGAHWVPERKSKSPIFPMAGTPEMSI